MTEIDKLLESLQQSGMVVLGAEFIPGMAKAAGITDAHKLFTALISQGRSRGIIFNRDQVSFDEIEFCRKLGEIGFDKQGAKSVVANLRPTPETSNVERF